MEESVFTVDNLYKTYFGKISREINWVLGEDRGKKYVEWSNSRVGRATQRAFGGNAPFPKPGNAEPSFSGRRALGWGLPGFRPIGEIPKLGIISTFRGFKLFRAIYPRFTLSRDFRAQKPREIPTKGPGKRLRVWPKRALWFLKGHFSENPPRCYIWGTRPYIRAKRAQIV